MKYGALPNNAEELLQYVKNRYPASAQRYDAALERIGTLEWKTMEFVLYLVPTPTPRPRYDGNHFYVKGAAQNKRLIKKLIEKHIISTRAEIDIKAFLPTPTSQLTNAEIYLAEARMIYPVGAADVDNLMKTYMDMIQGHLLLNDCIVTRGLLEKFYSIKPRLEITIRFQSGYDCRYNEKRVKKSKAYMAEFVDDGNKDISST